jgi:hypothetical protein
MPSSSPGIDLSILPNDDMKAFALVSPVDEVSIPAEARHPLDLLRMDSMALWVGQRIGDGASNRTNQGWLVAFELGRRIRRRACQLVKSNQLLAF